MEICFIDMMGVPEYDCDTPYTRPLGGTQSALCYYAEALAQKSHKVTVITANCAEIHTVRDVIFRPAKTLSGAPVNYSVVIWCSGPDHKIKTSLEKFVTGDLEICWIPHNINEPAVKDTAECLYKYDYFAFVSKWQRDLYVETYNIPVGKTMLMLNGNSPAFFEDFDAGEKLPHFIYTSQPDRGLDIVAKAWPEIVAKNPTAELHTYSSRKTYGFDDEEPINKLLNELRALPNVHVHDPVSQIELASAARRAAFFAYPTNFFETGCIACTEACAAGCLPIVSDLGVLGSYFNNCLHYDDTIVEQFVERASAYMDLFNTNRDAFNAQSERLALHYMNERDYAKLADSFIDTVNTLLVKKNDAVRTFNAARAAYAKNDYKQTRLLLSNMNQLFETQGNAFSYWLWMGVCHYHEVRLSAALAAFERAAKLNNTHQLCINMILVNEALGNTNEMIKWCENSLKYDFNINVINKILNAVQKLQYFDRCKWGRYLHSLWNNDINDSAWTTLFLSHGNMLVSDYTLVMKHEEGYKLMTDLIAKGIAFSNLHNIDLSENNINRINLDKLFSNLFLNMNYFDSHNPNYANAIKYYKENLPPLKECIMPRFEPITNGRKLRVGFLSGDLMYHPVSYILNGIVEHFDKSQFEVYTFSTAKPDSSNSMQEKIRKHSDHYFDLKTDDKAILKSILDADIDVLVEMCGHTTNGSALINVLRNKPARVVCQYFAFPNSYGVDEVDYKIGDKIVFPTGIEKYYTENLCKIDGGLHTYKPILDLTVNRVPHTGIIFGCFNNPKKFRPEWIKAVSQILRDVEGSRLKLRYFNLDDPSIRAFYVKEFEKHGVDKSRLDIGTGETLVKYFEAYGDVDIVLDPWPYNGGTINIEALYCSRPYITLLGNSYVSRVGASLLHQVGYTELIAHNAAEYVEKAVALAKDTARLEKYIAEIRPAAEKSTLLDNAAFTRKFEDGIKWMLREKKWLARA